MSSLIQAKPISIKASITEGILMGMSLHHLAGALHASKDDERQLDIVAGIIASPVDRQGQPKIAPDVESFAVIASGVADMGDTPDMTCAPFASQKFVQDCIERGGTIPGDGTWGITGVWHAIGVRSFGIHDLHHENGLSGIAQARIAFGNGHYGAVLWHPSGEREVVRFTKKMSFDPTTATPFDRLSVPAGVEIGSHHFLALRPEEQLSVLYREVSHSMYRTATTPTGDRS